MSPQDQSGNTEKMEAKKEVAMEGPATGEQVQIPVISTPPPQTSSSVNATMTTDESSKSVVDNNLLSTTASSVTPIASPSPAVYRSPHRRIGAEASSLLEKSNGTPSNYDSARHSDYSNLDNKKEEDVNSIRNVNNDDRSEQYDSNTDTQGNNNGGSGNGVNGGTGDDNDDDDEWSTVGPSGGKRSNNHRSKNERDSKTTRNSDFYRNDGSNNNNSDSLNKKLSTNTSSESNGFPNHYGNHHTHGNHKQPSVPNHEISMQWRRPAAKSTTDVDNSSITTTATNVDNSNTLETVGNSNDNSSITGSVPPIKNSWTSIGDNKNPKIIDLVTKLQDTNTTSATTTDVNNTIKDTTKEDTININEDTKLNSLKDNHGSSLDTKINNKNDTTNADEKKESIPIPEAPKKSVWLTPSKNWPNSLLSNSNNSSSKSVDNSLTNKINEANKSSTIARTESPKPIVPTSIEDAFVEAMAQQQMTKQKRTTQQSQSENSLPQGNQKKKDSQNSDNDNQTAPKQTTKSKSNSTTTGQTQQQQSTKQKPSASTIDQNTKKSNTTPNINTSEKSWSQKVKGNLGTESTGSINQSTERVISDSLESVSKKNASKKANSTVVESKVTSTGQSAKRANLNVKESKNNGTHIGSDGSSSQGKNNTIIHKKSNSSSEPKRSYTDESAPQPRRNSHKPSSSTSLSGEQKKLQGLDKILSNNESNSTNSVNFRNSRSRNISNNEPLPGRNYTPASNNARGNVQSGNVTSSKEKSQGNNRNSDPNHSASAPSSRSHSASRGPTPRQSSSSGYREPGQRSSTRGVSSQRTGNKNVNQQSSANTNTSQHHVGQNNNNSRFNNILQQNGTGRNDARNRHSTSVDRGTVRAPKISSSIHSIDNNRSRGVGNQFNHNSQNVKSNTNNNRSKSRHASTSRSRANSIGNRSIANSERSLAASGYDTDSRYSNKTSTYIPFKLKPDTSNIIHNTYTEFIEPKIKISSDFQNVVNEVAENLQKVLDEAYGTDVLKVRVFGSSKNGLGVSASDIDICLQTKDCFRDPPSLSFKNKFGASTEESIKDYNDLFNLEKLANILKSFNYTDVEPISTAKYPICKCKDNKYGISCDITFNNCLALYNTELLRLYTLIDPRVGPLILLVKIWAKTNALNNTRGVPSTLSSYGWSLLVISFLQCKGVICNLQDTLLCSAVSDLAQYDYMKKMEATGHTPSYLSPSAEEYADLQAQFEEQDRQQQETLDKEEKSVIGSSSFKLANVSGIQIDDIPEFEPMTDYSQNDEMSNPFHIKEKYPVKKPSKKSAELSAARIKNGSTTTTSSSTATGSEASQSELLANVLAESSSNLSGYQSTPEMFGSNNYGTPISPQTMRNRVGSQLEDDQRTEISITSPASSPRFKAEDEAIKDAFATDRRSSVSGLEDNDNDEDYGDDDIDDFESDDEEDDESIDDPEVDSADDVDVEYDIVETDTDSEGDSEGGIVFDMQNDEPSTGFPQSPNERNGTTVIPGTDSILGPHIGPFTESERTRLIICDTSMYCTRQKTRKLTGTYGERVARKGYKKSELTEAKIRFIGDRGLKLLHKYMCLPLDIYENKMRDSPNFKAGTKPVHRSVDHRLGKPLIDETISDSLNTNTSIVEAICNVINRDIYIPDPQHHTHHAEAKQEQSPTVGVKESHKGLLSKIEQDGPAESESESKMREERGSTAVAAESHDSSVKPPIDSPSKSNNNKTAEDKKSAPPIFSTLTASAYGSDEYYFSGYTEESVWKRSPSKEAPYFRGGETVPDLFFQFLHFMHIVTMRFPGQDVLGHHKADPELIPSVLSSVRLGKCGRFSTLELSQDKTYSSDRVIFGIEDPFLSDRDVAFQCRVFAKGCGAHLINRVSEDCHRVLLSNDKLSIPHMFIRNDADDDTDTNEPTGVGRTAEESSQA